MLTMLVWTPSIYRDTLACQRCNTSIKPQSVFYIDTYHIGNLAPNSVNSASSVRCATCGMLEFVVEQFKFVASDMETTCDNPKDRKEDPLVTIMRKIVRTELKKILQEEAHDPHGTFSPAP